MDWSELEARVRAVSREGAQAWPALAAALDTIVTRLARNQPIGRLRKDVDAVREVVAGVLARLHAHEFRAIHRYVESTPPPPIEAWLRLIVRTTAIDVLRRHGDYVRAGVDRAAGWVSLVSYVSGERGGEPSSLEAKRREVEGFLATALEHAREVHARSGADGLQQLAIAWEVEPLHVRRLVTKGERYLPVLRLVLAGHSYPEVAAQLGVTRREVELVVEYIEGLLHARRFA